MMFIKFCMHHFNKHPLGELLLRERQLYLLLVLPMP